MYNEDYGQGHRRHRGERGDRGWGDRGERGDRGWGGRGGFRGDRFYGDTATAAPSEEALALRQALFATVSAARQVVREGDPVAAAKAAELLNQARKGIYRLLAGDPE